MTLRFSGLVALCLWAVGAPAQAETGAPITVTGEFIDTWCYMSGVMGGPDAVVGSAHHTCALWCSAGGIPVGILAPDGTVYMVLKVGSDAQSNGSPMLLSMASDTVTAEGMLYQRDGLNYIVVNEIVDVAGITNPTHNDYGTVPDFVIPELQ